MSQDPPSPPRHTWAELEAAIWRSVCTTCGAGPGQLCKIKARTKILPQIQTTSNPHICRVYAAHDLLSRTNNSSTDNK